MNGLKQLWYSFFLATSAKTKSRSSQDSTGEEPQADKQERKKSSTSKSPLLKAHDKKCGENSSDNTTQSVESDPSDHTCNTGTSGKFHRQLSQREKFQTSTGASSQRSHSNKYQDSKTHHNSHKEMTQGTDKSSPSKDGKLLGITSCGSHDKVSPFLKVDKSERRNMNSKYVENNKEGSNSTTQNENEENDKLKTVDGDKAS